MARRRSSGIRLQVDPSYKGLRAGDRVCASTPTTAAKRALRKLASRQWARR